MTSESEIESFIAKKMYEAGADGFVLGVSGGLDSALVLKLAARSVGKDNVFGVLMPYNNEDMRDAQLLCVDEGVKYTVVDITPMVDAFTIALRPSIKSRGNIKARCRMIVLYHIALERKSLVLGTGNKSELMTGYFTKHGDGGVDLLPIGDIYKTDVFKMAERVGVPDRIIRKVPSAGLWPGQTDEGELGVTYTNIDAVLYQETLAESWFSDYYTTGINECPGLSAGELYYIKDMVKKSEHKRRMPPTPGSP